MGSNRIMIWRFRAAPMEFRSLHPGSSEPEWVVFVPRSVRGPDVEEAFVSGAGTIFQYETKDGDVVYIGTSSLDAISENVAALFRPEAAPKRKSHLAARAASPTPRLR